MEMSRSATARRATRRSISALHAQEQAARDRRAVDRPRLQHRLRERRALPLRAELRRLGGGRPARDGRHAAPLRSAQRARTQAELLGLIRQCDERPPSPGCSARGRCSAGPTPSARPRAPRRRGAGALTQTRSPAWPASAGIRFTARGARPLRRATPTTRSEGRAAPHEHARRTVCRGGGRWTSKTTDDNFLVAYIGPGASRPSSRSSATSRTRPSTTRSASPTSPASRT